MDEHLLSSVIRAESYSSKMYKCPAGKFTIGYGRNIQDRGIRKDEAELMLKNDIRAVELELMSRILFFTALDRVRQNVLIEMAYNMGVPKLMKFKKTLKFIHESDYESASKEMLDSKWHRDFVKYDMQDGKRFDGLLRSEYLSKIMKEGKY